MSPIPDDDRSQSLSPNASRQNQVGSPTSSASLSGASVASETAPVELPQSFDGSRPYNEKDHHNIESPSLDSSDEQPTAKQQHEQAQNPVNVYKESDIILTSEPPQAKKLPAWRKYLNMFRPGYLLDHRDYDSFRTIMPTWVHVWASVFLCIIPRVSHWFGGGAYILQIMGFIVAPGGQSIVLNIFVSVTCGLYMVAAWVFSIVAMAITTKIRGWPTQEFLLEQLIAEGTCTMQSGEECLQGQIYTGRFLETKCTAVWIIALTAGMTVFGLSESIHPVMRLPFVSAVITLIIQCCYNVFWPIFSPLPIGLNVIKPMGVAFALRVVIGFIIFPFTSSWKFWDGTGNILKALARTNRSNTRFLKTMQPSADNFINFSQFSKDITSIRVRLPALDLFERTLKYEVSVGRLDAGETGQYRSYLRNLISVTAGFEYFYQLLAERKDVASNIFASTGGLNRRNTHSSMDHATGNSKLLSTLRESYREVAQFEKKSRSSRLKKQFEGQNPSERVTLVDLDYISQHLKEIFVPLMEAINEVFDALSDWVTAANEFRTYHCIVPKWKRQSIEQQAQAHDRLLAAKALLLEELAKARSAERQQATLMKAAARNEETILTFISQSSMFLNSANEQSREMLKMTELFLSIDDKRPRPKIIHYWTKSTYATPANFVSGSNADDPTAASGRYLRSQVRARDADALPPTNIFTKTGRICIDFYNNYILNEHIWFWIRVGGLVNICAIPYYCRTTAAWYFENRLIWLPIVCGVSTAEYSAETVYMFVVKLVYSFIGSLVGLVCWYISAGRGRGNYYGFAAVTAVAYFLVSYYRQFSIHMTRIPAIMIAVTPVLTLGTSWVDTYSEAANVGHGLRPAITRFVSVAIGLFAAFLATIFPRVKSSKAAVRNSLANALENIGNLHCNVSQFAIQRLNNPNLHIAIRHDPMMEKFRQILLTLARVKALMQPIQYELNFYGDWPKARYEKLQALVNDIIQLYFLLFLLVDQIQDPQSWMPNIIGRCGWSNGDLTADIFSLVHMNSESLRSKSSLPKVTRATVSVKHLDILRRQWGIEKISLSERFYTREPTLTDTDTTRSSGSTFLASLDFDKLFSHDGQLNIVSLLLSHLIYKRLDEVSITAKRLVGEKFDIEEELLWDVFEDDMYDHGHPKQS